MCQEPQSPSLLPLLFPSTTPPPLLSYSVEEQTNALKKLLGLPVKLQDPPSNREAADPAKSSSLFNKMYIHQKLELELLSNYSNFNQACGEREPEKAAESDLPFKKFLLNDLRICCFPSSNLFGSPFNTDTSCAHTAFASSGDSLAIHGYDFERGRLRENTNRSVGDANFSWHLDPNQEPDFHREQYPTHDFFTGSENRINLYTPNYFTKPVCRRGLQQKRRIIFIPHAEYTPWLPHIENTSFVHCVQFRNMKRDQTSWNSIKAPKFRSSHTEPREACHFRRFPERSCFNTFHAMSGDFSHKKRFFNMIR